MIYQLTPIFAAELINVKMIEKILAKPDKTIQYKLK
jgi:hypothetical protein